MPDTIEDVEVEDRVSGTQESKDSKTGDNEIPLPKTSNKSGASSDGPEIDWETNSFAANITDQPTIDSKAAESDDIKAEEPSDKEKDAYMKDELDGDDSGKLSLEDLKLTAELVIELFDAVNSTAVGAWTKEKAERFELTATKRKTLTTILAKAFYRYQAKLGPIAALVIASLLYFGMTWKMGWDIKKAKKLDAEQEAIEKRKAKNMARKQAFRNIISSAIGQQTVSLKEIAKRMGRQTKDIKQHIKIMCDNGELFADHTKGIVQYRIAD